MATDTIDISLKTRRCGSGSRGARILWRPSVRILTWIELSFQRNARSSDRPAGESIGMGICMSLSCHAGRVLLRVLLVVL